MVLELNHLSDMCSIGNYISS